MAGDGIGEGEAAGGEECGGTLEEEGGGWIGALLLEELDPNGLNRRVKRPRDAWAVAGAGGEGAGAGEEVADEAAGLEGTESDAGCGEWAGDALSVVTLSPASEPTRDARAGDLDE